MLPLRNLRSTFLILFHFSFFSSSLPVAIDSLSDGPVIAENFADPSFIEVKNTLDNSVTYYAFSTGSSHGNTPVATSSDFINWKIVGDALPSIPSWSFGSIWAPDVVQLVSIFFLPDFTFRRSLEYSDYHRPMVAS